MTTCETCRKIEKALERIQFTCENTHGGLIWDWDHAKGVARGYLRLLWPRHEHPNIIWEPVKCEQSCDIPQALVELADMVDPPKPKEREWRVGDVVMLKPDEEGYVQVRPNTPYLITKDFPALIKQVIVGGTNICRSRLRNLTILAE